MKVPRDQRNTVQKKVLRPKRCAVLDGKPCAACTEDIKLEQEIRELEQMIEKLHNRRRALRTVMNENHDHLIHKFPPEIASHIFIQYAPPSVNSYKGGRSTPLLLGSVCRKWRQLAWATPQLWSSIVIGPDKVPLGLVAEWLERSASLPLTIKFYGYSGQLKGVSQILNKHSARWYDMYLYIPPTFFRRFDGLSQGNILHRLVLRTNTSPNTHSDPPKFSMKSEPRPTDLTLLEVGLPCVVIIWNNLTVASLSEIDVGDCVELIRRAPLLHTLRMREINSLSGIFPLPNTRIVHPHLHALELQITDRSASVGFLDSVCLPSLEQWIHERDIFLVEHMISFIEWSPRLKVLKVSTDNIPDHQVAQLLSHLSTLELLELRSFQDRYYRISDLIYLLCASGESTLFLPRMQSLEFVCTSSGSFPWDSLDQLFVSPRWRSLRVKVNVRRGWRDVEDESVDLLRELIDKGFDLSVGDEIDALQEGTWHY